MAKKQAVNGERGRWSAKAKREAVLRLLRGEAIDTLSCELKVTAAKLSEWREAFLAGGEANLKSRERHLVCALYLAAIQERLRGSQLVCQAKYSGASLRLGAVGYRR